MNNENNNQVNVFIPFVPRHISAEFITETFEQQMFGKTTEIHLHDKKIKTNNILRSAKHNYAFITLELYDTTPGNNLRHNILHNKNTYMMCDYKDHIIHWQVKPYLNIHDRMERGFDLHIKKEEKEEKEEKENLPEWLDSSMNFMFDLFENHKTKLSLLLPDKDSILPVLHKGQMAPRNYSYFDSLSEKDENLADYEEIEKSIDLERMKYQTMLETL
tara:strand:- start:968 stop:1618 length:651 start_codon:yes stop_codon:yes gene_type:complete